MIRGMNKHEAINAAAMAVILITLGIAVVLSWS
jgi:hypothetical protein